jgi:hypothetical protein
MFKYFSINRRVYRHHILILELRFLELHIKELHILELHILELRILGLSILEPRNKKEHKPLFHNY